MEEFKVNVTMRNSRAVPECTSCGHRYDTRSAANPYREMCAIAKGKFSFCPACGAKYVGCQIEGVDFDKCESNLQDWINRGAAAAFQDRINSI